MIFELLEQNGIHYERVDHIPVYTCDEAKQHVPPLPGRELKNLFLRDGKGKKHFLLSIPAEKRVNLKALGASLGISGLGLASPERLKLYLGLEPGAVTLLGVVNDQSGSVEVLIDSDLSDADAYQCHPLVNTSTISISKSGLEKFFSLTKHTPRYINIPA
ncbi:MAG: prolyl-tRNA synthetase associated domain-containing protein [Bdellovibrionota bacterium]